jgi:VWFA-related protein
VGRAVIDRARGPLGLSLVLVAAAVTALGAQEVFRASTDMVFLSVTATRGGHRVGGLQREQFSVIEEGRSQEIAVFSADPQPIALSILLDTSMSMDTKMGIAADAAVGFVRRLREGDVAQVITFDTSTQIPQTFTSDTALLEQAIRTARPSGSTALYTAIYVAFSELERVRPRQSGGELRRQAIIVLSDGEDTASRLRHDDVLERARRSDVLVFTIALRDRVVGTRPANEYDFVLRTLAQTTGARFFQVDHAMQLPEIYTQIADELASQYTIGYVSKNAARDGSWRQIAVRVSEPGVVARTRAGYYVPRRTP